MDPKARTRRRIDAERSSLLDLSHTLHGHPELAYEEIRSSALLAGALEAGGMRVDRGPPPAHPSDRVHPRHRHAWRRRTQHRPEADPGRLLRPGGELRCAPPGCSSPLDPLTLQWSSAPFGAFNDPGGFAAHPAPLRSAGLLLPPGPPDLFEYGSVPSPMCAMLDFSDISTRVWGEPQRRSLGFGMEGGETT